MANRGDVISVDKLWNILVPAVDLRPRSLGRVGEENGGVKSAALELLRDMWEKN